jgi:hypothetical protein
VLSIRRGPETITSPEEIRDVFYQHLKQQLGTAAATILFDPRQIYT